MTAYWPRHYWPRHYWPYHYWPGGTGATPVSPVSTAGMTATGMGGTYIVLLKNLDGEIIAIFSGGGHGVSLGG